MRIVFMGTPDFAEVSLRRLLDERFDVVGVFTQPDKPKNRGMKLAASPVKELALQEGIPVFQPGKMRDGAALEQVQSLRPDILVVVAYGKILPDEILAVPKYGAINVHGSLLPQYRGAAPIQWAVLNGDTRTGVTTMYLDREMDTGDVIFTDETEIGAYETAGELFGRLGYSQLLPLIGVSAEERQEIAENNELEGMSAREIAQGLRRLKSRLRLFTVLDTLEYLRKGGRVSSLAAAAGSVISIKPLITETGGNVKVIGKSRGMKNGAKALAKEVAKCGGIDFDMPYTFAYSGTSRENLDKFLDSHPEVFEGKPREDLPAYCVGSIIGTHVGSNAFAVAFYAKQ